MFKSLTRKKSIESIMASSRAQDATEGHGVTGLHRVLTARDLTFFGIAAIIGAGSFSSLGGAVFALSYQFKYPRQIKPLCGLYQF